MEIWGFANDRVIEQPAFDGFDHALDVPFLIHKSHTIGERDRCDDVEGVPLEPFSKIEVFALHPIEFSLQDIDAAVGHWFKFDQCAHRIRTGHRPLESFMMLLIPDGKHCRKGFALLRFHIER